MRWQQKIMLEREHKAHGPMCIWSCMTLKFPNRIISLDWCLTTYGSTTSFSWLSQLGQSSCPEIFRALYAWCRGMGRKVSFLSDQLRHMYYEATLAWSIPVYGQNDHMGNCTNISAFALCVIIVASCRKKYIYRESLNRTNVRELQPKHLFHHF